MSIKPLDFQVMVPKTTEISRIRHDEQHKNDLFQQQQAAVVQQKSEDNIRQVYTQENVQEARIKEKQKGKQKDKQEKKGRANYSKNKKQDDVQSQGSTIDIRI